jgi:hypothetical protein
MVMDWVRRGYRTKMRLWADKPDLVEVRWFRAPKGAKFFPGPHAFTSRQLYPIEYKDDEFPVGEVPGKTAYDDGQNVSGYVGTNFCGRVEAFLLGGVTGVDQGIPTGPGGAAACCNVADPDDGEVEVGGEDLVGEVDTEEVAVGGGDEVVAQYPFRQGPFVVGSTWTVVIADPATPLRDVCFVIANISAAAQWISIHLINNTSSQAALLERVNVPAYTTVCFCCGLTINAGENVIGQASADFAFSVSSHGWSVS